MALQHVSLAQGFWKYFTLQIRRSAWPRPVSENPKSVPKWSTRQDHGQRISRASRDFRQRTRRIENAFQQALEMPRHVFNRPRREHIRAINELPAQFAVVFPHAER